MDENKFNEVLDHLDSFFDGLAKDINDYKEERKKEQKNEISKIMRRCGESEEEIQKQMEKLIRNGNDSKN